MLQFESNTFEITLCFKTTTGTKGVEQFAERPQVASASGYSIVERILGKD